MSLKITNHERRLYTWVDLLSNCGGLFSSVFSILAIFGSIINKHYLLHKILRAIFFIKDKAAPTKNVSESLTIVSKFKYGDTLKNMNINFKRKLW